ncbi:MAG: chemotaxis protein CheD [Vicinamibacterales bacterium]
MASPVPSLVVGSTAVPPRAAAAGGRIVVGIGEFAVSSSPDDVIVTHALGSCIAVCIWDPVVRVGGLLHFLLPESKINPERARKQPATFADTGIPLLFQTAYASGIEKKRCHVRLVGGAEVAGMQGVAALNVGKRNLLVARQILWQNGVLVNGEATGGTIPRSVALRASDGVVEVTSARDVVASL